MSNNNNKLSVTGKMDTLGANIVGIILATGAALQAKADRAAQKAANIAAAEPYLFEMQNALEAWKIAKNNVAIGALTKTPEEIAVLAADRTSAWDTYRTARNTYNALPK